jgi:hypothetical protein
MSSVDALWGAIADELGVFMAESVSDDQEEVAGRESVGEGGLNLALTGKWSRKTSESIARRGTTQGRERTAVYAGCEDPQLRIAHERLRCSPPRRRGRG